MQLRGGQYYLDLILYIFILLFEGVQELISFSDEMILLFEQQICKDVQGFYDVSRFQVNDCWQNAVLPLLELMLIFTIRNSFLNNLSLHFF